MLRLKLWSHLEASVRLKRAAVAAAKGDPQAEMIVQEFNDRSFASMVTPEGIIVALESGIVKRAHAAIVVIMPDEIPYVDRNLPSCFFYDLEKLFFIYKYPWTEWYLGVIAMHEMHHWYDLRFTEHEKPGPPMTPVYIHGEVTAHKAEDAALNRLTHGDWHTSIEETLRDSKYQLPKKGKFIFPNSAGIQHMLSALPGKKIYADEYTSRAGSATVGMLFAQCPNDRKRARAYKTMINDAKITTTRQIPSH